MGVEKLPLFFRELIPYRGEKANTRKFVETFRTQHYPTEGNGYRFLVTTHLLSSLRTLSFAGEDPMCAYSLRARGVSVFSLAPLGEHHLSASSREQMLAYERTESHHAPKDALEQIKMEVEWASLPGTRIGTLEWVEHVTNMTAIFFGPRCPLNEYQGRLLQCLRNPNYFITWQTEDWKALVWQWHRGYRSFMVDCSTAGMTWLATSVESGGMPNRNILPIELRSATPTDSYSPSGDHKRPTDTTRKPDEKDKRQKGGIQALSKDFPTTILQGSSRMPFGISVGMLCPNAEAVNNLLGPEILACLTPGKDPCLKKHVFGNCRMGDRCFRDHQVLKSPSKEALKGLHTRLSKRVKELVAQHPK